MHDASIFIVCLGAGLEPLSPDILYAYARIIASSEWVNDFPGQFLSTPCAIQMIKPIATIGQVLYKGRGLLVGVGWFTPCKGSTGF